MVKKVVIGIDIRDLRIAQTGAKTYLQELNRAFGVDDPSFSFVFIDTFLPVYTGKVKWLKLLEHGRFLLWKQLLLPMLAYFRGCDLIFCTDYFVPYFAWGMKTIPVFHDAFFWEYPDHYNKYWLKLFYHLGVGAAKRSPYVITSSLYAKDRIAHYSGIDAAKIIPIYEAPKKLPFHTSASNNPLDTEYDFLWKTQYILHVGTFEKRKNLPLLIRAFQRLKENGHDQLKLVLLGQSSPKQNMDDSANIKKLISALGLGKAVLMPGYVEDTLLAKFYSHATIFAFPSRNEGFGIPVLEAFGYRLPVIIANNSCLPEIAGEAALTFDPDDETALLNLLHSLLINEEAREELAKKTTERLAFFSWEKTANELKIVFRRAVND